MTAVNRMAQLIEQTVSADIIIQALCAFKETESLNEAEKKIIDDAIQIRVDYIVNIYSKKVCVQNS
jgi:hypothetical protein